MTVENPQTVTGKLVKHGKHLLVKIACPWCRGEHLMREGLRVPHCNSQMPDYTVQARNETNENTPTAPTPTSSKENAAKVVDDTMKRFPRLPGESMKDWMKRLSTLVYQHEHFTQKGSNER